MPWLVKSQCAAAGQAKCCLSTPGRGVDRRAFNLVSLQSLDLSLQVVAHQMKLGAHHGRVAFRVPGRAFDGMDSGLGGRQRKDQPAVARIHRFKSENLAKEKAIRLGIFAVEKDVSSGDHEEKSSRPNWAPSCCCFLKIPA